MAFYRVIHDRSFAKDLRRRPSWLVKKVSQYARGLAEDPFPRQSTKLSGSDALYKIRIGDYRLVYEVDIDQKLVTLHLLDDRSDAYKRIRRRT